MSGHDQTSGVHDQNSLCHKISSNNYNCRQMAPRRQKAEFSDWAFEALCNTQIKVVSTQNAVCARENT